MSGGEEGGEEKRRGGCWEKIPRRKQEGVERAKGNSERLNEGWGGGSQSPTPQNRETGGKKEGRNLRILDEEDRGCPMEKVRQVVPNRKAIQEISSAPERMKKGNEGGC